MTTSTSKRVPQYRAIHNDIVARITSGEWEAGSALPPLAELTERYGASRMTVLKALHLLEEGAYVSVEQGRGTFVSDGQAGGQLIAILCGDDVLAVPAPAFAAGVCRGLTDWLRDAGYRPQLFVVDSDMLADAVYPSPNLWREIRRGQTAGIALVATEPLPGLLADAAARGLPVVDVGANIDHPAHVSMDNTDMVIQSLQYLAVRGRRRVGFVTSDATMAAAFMHECAQLQLQTDAAWINELATAPTESPVGDERTAVRVESAGFALLHELWQQPERPDAMLIADDIAAKGVSQAALALGLRVPEDLMLVAQTSTALPMFYPVPVVRCEFDASELVQRAGGLLLTQLRGGDARPCAPIRFRIREPMP
jgi:DNA-binding LacI/PurR family transcriptional regulator